MDADERRLELERLHAQWSEAMARAWASGVGSPEGVEARRAARRSLDEYVRILLEHYREKPPIARQPRTTAGPDERRPLGAGKRPPGPPGPRSCEGRAGTPRQADRRTAYAGAVKAAAQVIDHALAKGAFTWDLEPLGAELSHAADILRRGRKAPAEGARITVVSGGLPTLGKRRSSPGSLGRYHHQRMAVRPRTPRA